MADATSRRMRIAFILDTSHGIDLETIKQYHVDGWCVIIIVRTQEAVHAPQALGAKTYVLDLTDANAVAGLTWKLDGEALGVAIYVVSIHDPRTQGTMPISQADFDTVIHANVWTSMGVLPAVLPMVEAGRNGADGSGDMLAVISSHMDNIDDMTGNGGWLYRASKAAMNTILRGVSVDARSTTRLTFHPDWVQTDTGGADAAITPQESVAGTRRVIVSATRVDNGGFRNYDGSVIE